MYFALTAKLRAALEDADRLDLGISDFVLFRSELGLVFWIFFLHLYNTHCNALTELRPLALHV